MIKTASFDEVVILGNGYSAQLSAIALEPIIKHKRLIGPVVANPSPSGPEELTGQHAHSHVFLPRLEAELRRIDPGILDGLGHKGLCFRPGSRRLSESAPLESRRLFATRWQFDDAIYGIYQDKVRAEDVHGSVETAIIDQGAIRSIALANGTVIQTNDTTLILDAMGAGSPVMGALISGCDSVQDHSSNIVYITQFFRLREGSEEDLPDPLVDCPHDFGVAHLMLYPALDDWFSVTAAVATEHKDLVQKLRDQEQFILFCKDHPHVASWLQKAEPVGRCRLFINPRNRWNTSVFEGGYAPKNYLAVGDALTSMIPTLGANCSFAATHIRIMRDLVQTPPMQLQQKFSEEVHKEQFRFFQSAVKTVRPARAYVSYKDAPQNRLSKRVKRRLRRILGLDRARILRSLAASSSL